MLTINTNLSSLVAQSSLKTSTNKLNQAIERMTTGFKINHASDNAAGYSISTNMSSKLSSYEVAMDNASMGLDMITTATDSMELITSHLQRMRDLAEQAANGTYGKDSLKAIQAEIDARKAEVGRIVNNTEYNGIKFFGKDDGNAIDESKRVVNQTTFTAGETYYVTNSDDLVKLQDLVNSGVDTKDVTFELTKNIDMTGVTFRGIGNSSSHSFKGTFNGNSHKIMNLTINTAEDYVGLFGYVEESKIDSVGLENCNISGQNNVGGLVGYAYTGGSTGLQSLYIANSYVTGSIQGSDYTGGVVGNAQNSVMILRCYSDATVSGKDNTGGLAGNLGRAIIMESYSRGRINGYQQVGGLVGTVGANSTLEDCYAATDIMAKMYIGGLLGDTRYGNVKVTNCHFDKQLASQRDGVGNGTVTGSISELTTAELYKLIENGTLPPAYSYAEDPFGGFYEVSLQVGINSDPSSTITIDIGIGKIELNIDVTTADGARDALTTLDEYLKSLNERQTKLGASYNRLESVIESIGINIDNLVSSRSTLRDADIAELSSTYIQQQILQQASATLLATANQSPSVALQLL